MTTPRHAPTPSKVLGEIQMMLVGELVARPADPMIALDRHHVVIVQAALGEMIGQIEVLEESAAAADRLTAELHRVHAEIERWKRAAESYHDAWAREVGHAAARSLRLVECGNVVDMREAFGRERRDAGRPIGPEGGAA